MTIHWQTVALGNTVATAGCASKWVEGYRYIEFMVAGGTWKVMTDSDRTIRGAKRVSICWNRRGIFIVASCVEGD